MRYADEGSTIYGGQMALKRIKVETLQKTRDELHRLANSIDSTVKLAEQHSIELQSNQLGNLSEGMKRLKKFVIDADNRLREVIFLQESS